MHAWLVRDFVALDALGDERNLLINDVATATLTAFFFIVLLLSTFQRENVQQEVEHGIGVVDSETVFSVGVHSNGNWGLFLDSFLYVVLIRLVGGRRETLKREEFAVGVRAEFLFIAHFILHELVELSFAHLTVVVIDDVSTLHDFSEELLEVVEWHD